MVKIERTDVFARWLARLRDKQAQYKIEARVLRLSRGNPGQVRNVGRGISEMKVDFGPGYRVYYQQRGSTLVILLCGGDKDNQQRDIALAYSLADAYKKGEFLWTH